MDKGKTDGGAIQIKDVPVGIVPDVPPPAAGVIRIEGESFVPATKPSGGTIRSQTLGSAYSGDKQLWWTNGHPGDVLTLKLDQGNVGTGSYDVTLFPTYSWDYAQIKVKMGGQEKSVDLYAKKVRPGDPLQFNEVVVKPDAPLLIEIQITDKNAAAKPGYMAGFDRIELRPSEVN